ncbi:sensor histidine kinase [Chitinophaga skermanii]|nr:HAMP domain-containing sensor histidine kinase [Chitinophaga skermanii]
MKLSITAYKVISIVSFLILSTLQFVLVYNTYKLTDERYFFNERKTMDTAYGKTIINDILFPGGGKVMDKYIYPNMHTLEVLHDQDTAAFNQYKALLVDSIFTMLRANSNMDSVMHMIIQKNGLSEKLEYALHFDLVDISFKKNQYVNIFNYNSPQKSRLSLISGTLQTPSNKNKISTVTVTSPADYTTRVSFSLYADISNRSMVILQRMLPTLVISLFSLFCVVLLFFITFRNWVKQKQLSEMKSDFINSMSHELNTPLAAIIVANKGLQNEQILENKAQVRSLTDVINRQSERLKKLIGQVLDITRSNQVVLQKEPLILQNALQEIISDYRYKITDPSIQMTGVLAEGEDTIEADRFWLTTILVNLIENAIKYNDQPNKVVNILLRRGKKHLYIEVADNGIGIPSNIQSHIFDKFYRAQTNLKTNNGLGLDLGLGLFNVQQAVLAHGWSISVTSKPGQGSTFIVRIPNK